MVVQVNINTTPQSSMAQRAFHLFDVLAKMLDIQ
jgi:hypothetical protein